MLVNVPLPLFCHSALESLPTNRSSLPSPLKSSHCKVGPPDTSPETPLAVGRSTPTSTVPMGEINGGPAVFEFRSPVPPETPVTNDTPIDMSPPGKCNGTYWLAVHSENPDSGPLGRSMPSRRTRLLSGTVGVPSLSSSGVQVVAPVMLRSR